MIIKEYLLSLRLGVFALEINGGDFLRTDHACISAGELQIRWSK